LTFTHSAKGGFVGKRLVPNGRRPEVVIEGVEWLDEVVAHGDLVGVSREVAARAAMGGGASP
jgi:hypothetical protein